MKERRLTAALVVAGVLHVAVALLLWRSSGIARTSPALPAPPEEIPVEMDVAVLSEPASAVAARSDEPPAAAAATRSSGARAAPSPGSAEGVSAEPEMAGEASAGEAVLEAPSGAEGWSFNPVRPEQRFAMTGRVRPSEAAPAVEPRRTYGVTEALDARDRDLGLSRAGPLLAATEDAAREAGPTEGRAVFALSVDRDHNVVVSLERADAPDAWRGVLDVVKRHAQAKSVRIPPTANGIYVQIEIDAAVVWPDNQKVKETSKPAEGFARGVVVDRENGTVTTPQAGVTVRGKVCNATVRLPGVRVGQGGIEILNPIVGGCSPENIASTAVRLIHGRIVKESRL